MTDLHKELNPTSVRAVEVILRTMQVAESGQHTPGSWTKEGALHHVRHAYEHIEELVFALREDTLPDPDWGDLEHALTRLAMAVRCHQRGLDGDYGVEGNG